MRLERRDGLGEADVPQTDLAAEAAEAESQRVAPVGMEEDGALCRRQLAVPAPLHVHILHPCIVETSVPPHHVVARRKPPVVDSQAAVSESRDDDVASDLVARHRSEARIGSRWEVLQSRKSEQRQV
jgi:hypothetical protein